MSDIGHYRGKVEGILNSISVDVGDRIQIKRKDHSDQEGLLMPGDRSGQNKHVVIKLDNGYNIGIEVTENTTIKEIPEKND